MAKAARAIRRIGPWIDRLASELDAAPEDYYELTNSQPPAACVGCQAWSKAQDSGSCPVGVRRFKSCPTHPSGLDSDQKLQAIRFRRCRVIGHRLSSAIEAVATWSMRIRKGHHAPARDRVTS